jgi:hypothetical protein
MSPELLAEYYELLRQTQDMLTRHRAKQWATVLQEWRAELTDSTRKADLQRHLERTARALGGMESIGEVALSRHDNDFKRGSGCALRDLLKGSERLSADKSPSHSSSFLTESAHPKGELIYPYDFEGKTPTFAHPLTVVSLSFSLFSSAVPTTSPNAEHALALRSYVVYQLRFGCGGVIDILTPMQF